MISRFQSGKNSNHIKDYTVSKPSVYALISLCIVLLRLARCIIPLCSECMGHYAFTKYTHHVQASLFTPFNCQTLIFVKFPCLSAVFIVLKSENTCSALPEVMQDG